MLDKQLARALQAFFCKRNGLGFPHRVADHSLLMQSIHRSPIVPLPSSAVVVQRQKEQRQHHVIDFIFIIFHALIVQPRVAAYKICHIIRLTSRWSQRLPGTMFALTT
jgi:hypothetical protein